LEEQLEEEQLEEEQLKSLEERLEEGKTCQI